MIWFIYKILLLKLFKNDSIIKKLRSLRSALLKEFSRFSLLALKEFSRFSSLTRKTFLYFVRLKFMKSKKIRISLLSRYLILFIILLFSCLFYLSIPTLYNHGQLQKDLTKKLSQEFNLNTALSANIHYKILPSPNFEISNVLLNTNDNNKFNDYAQIKTMKIYVSLKNLHNKNRLEILGLDLMVKNNTETHSTAFPRGIPRPKSRILTAPLLMLMSIHLSKPMINSSIELSTISFSST